MSTKEDNAKTNTEKWYRHTDESHNYFKTHCSFSGNKEECVDEILCSLAYCCYDPLLIKSLKCMLLLQIQCFQTFKQKVKVTCVSRKMSDYIAVNGNISFYDLLL